jgi:hypothetical protein
MFRNSMFVPHFTYLRLFRLCCLSYCVRFLMVLLQMIQLYGPSCLAQISLFIMRPSKYLRLIDDAKQALQSVTMFKYFKYSD